MEKNLSVYTFYYFLSLVLMRGGGILAKIVLARSITPYEYGLITLFVIVLPGMLQNVTNFCFYDILGHASEGKKYLGFSLFYGIVATAFLALIFFIFHETIFRFLNIPPEYWEILSIVLFITLFSVTLGGVIIGYLRGSRNHLLAATVSTAPSLLRVLFLIFAIYMLGIENFSVIIVLFALPPFITLIPVIVLKFREITQSLKMITLPHREMFLFGFSFFILAIWVGLSQQITSVVISHDLGVEWQAYYDVSLSIATVITFFSSAIYLISAPETTTKDYTSDILKKKGGLGDVGRLFFSVSLLSVIVIYFYSQQLVSLLFTSRYLPSAEFLYLLAIGYTVLFVQQYISFLSISSDRRGISRLVLVTVASILLFPLFSHIMITYFQFLGAYLASALFIFGYTLVTILLIKDRSPFFLLMKKIDRLTLSILGTCLVVYFFHLPLLPGIIVATIVYAVLIMGSGYLDKEMMMDMVSLKKKRT
jgi:O-antigen/teichoic acid export membrane protein